MINRAFYGVHIWAEDGSGHLATLCNRHASELGHDMSGESEFVTPMYSWDEVDSYECCDVHECDEVFDYVSLTEDGHQWLAEVKEEEIERIKAMDEAEQTTYFEGEAVEGIWVRAWIFGNSAFEAARLAGEDKMAEAIEVLGDA